MSVGSGPRYVFTSFVSSRHSSITGTISWSPRIARSTLPSVEYPVLPLRPGVSSSFSKRMRAELLRRAEDELLAGEVVRAGLELLDAVFQPCRDLAHAIGVDADARVLHRAEHDG